LVKKEPEHLQKSQLLHRIILIILLFDLGTYVRLPQIINLKTLSFGHCRWCPLSSTVVILQLLVSMYESLQIYQEFVVSQLWIGRCCLSFERLRLIIIKFRSWMDCNLILKIAVGFEECLESGFPINLRLQPNSLQHESLFKN